MSVLLSWTFGYAGFAALCFAGAKHHRPILGRSLRRDTARALRAVGLGFLAGALAQLVGGEASVFLGIVEWLGVLTAAALTLVFTLPYWPRVALGAAVVTPLLSTLALLSRL